MTAAELIKILQEVPDDTPVGRSGHFGELIELYGAHPSKSVREETGPKNDWGRNAALLPLVVVLEISDIGELED